MLFAKMCSLQPLWLTQYLSRKFWSQCSSIVAMPPNQPHFIPTKMRFWESNALQLLHGGITLNCMRLQHVSCAKFTRPVVSVYCAANCSSGSLFHNYSSLTPLGGCAFGILRSQLRNHVFYGRCYLTPMPLNIGDFHYFCVTTWRCTENYAL